MTKKSQIAIVLEYGLARLFVGILLRLPYRIAINLGTCMGNLAHRLLSRRRALIKRNLTWSFPDSDDAEADRLAKVVFQNIGKTMIESLYAARWTKERLLAQVEVQGINHLEEALARGRGVLLSSAHYGNWEMMPMAINAMGYKLKVIARRMDNPRLEILVNRIRSQFGTGVLVGADGLKEMIRCLRRNEALGILMDLNQYENGVFVDFFRRPAATTPIVALLAKRTGAAILPIHTFRMQDGRHRIIIEQELLPVHAEDQSRCIEIHTRLCNQVMENWIREDPSQWFWVHDRWKTRPRSDATSHPIFEPLVRPRRFPNPSSPG